jgi:hypothetical protein
MTKLTLAKTIAAIVVFGHVLLFGFGLYVMSMSPFEKSDTAQMILMGSPLLAMIALSAYRFIANLPDVDESSRVSFLYVVMSIFVTSAFLIALFVIYDLARRDNDMPVNILKFMVGAVETVLGGYLGVNRDLLFPDPKS